VSEPPASDTPELEPSSEGGFLDLDILVEPGADPTPSPGQVAAVSAAAPRRKARAEEQAARTTAAESPAQAPDTASATVGDPPLNPQETGGKTSAKSDPVVLRAMPIVDLGTASEEGFEVGSRGLRRSPPSMPPNAPSRSVPPPVDSANAEPQDAAAPVPPETRPSFPPPRVSVRPAAPAPAPAPVPAPAPTLAAPQAAPPQPEPKPAAPPPPPLASLRPSPPQIQVVTSVAPPQTAEAKASFPPPRASIRPSPPAVVAAIPAPAPETPAKIEAAPNPEAAVKPKATAKPEPVEEKDAATEQAAHVDLPAADFDVDGEDESLDVPSNRISEIPPEVDPEDLEITEIPRAARGLQPPGPPPMLPLPSYARPDLAAAVEAERATEDQSVRRARYWWDEMFGDDFLRTMDRLTDSQVRHEVEFIEESLGVQEGAIILDLACGSGRHAVEMAVRGYNVVGYDLSVAMLARAADEAHDRNQKLNFLQGDMRDMGFEEMFDAVYCWSTSFGYFDDEKNQLVAQRIHRALRKGGLLLLDVANRDFVAKVQPSLVWFEGEGCVCMDDMRVDFITSRLRVKRMIMLDDGRSRELDYSIRLYTLHELGNMLHDVGFKVIEVSGHIATPKVFMGADSPRLLVLAEKA
jgi:SAM-dependent methyltransferase